MEISRFNPHSMSDSQVRLLSTGRDRLLTVVVDALIGGPGVRQQVLVTAPRGYGKSFFARAVQLAVVDGNKKARVTILPEEQRNVSTPSSLLREITRGLKGAPAESVAGLFLDDPPGAWDAAREELEATLSTLDADFTQIVVIENFDELIGNVFDEPAAQSQLRALLSESEHLAILATATTSQFDRDYEQRLFHAFAKFSLQPWTEDDHVLYFERRAVFEGRTIASLDRGKIRALAQFTGGAPRMAVALANLLLENDPLSAAALLDKLVDDLTPYYQALIEQMPTRTRTLFDALIRLKEPVHRAIWQSAWARHRTALHSTSHGYASVTWSSGENVPVAGTFSTKFPTAYLSNTTANVTYGVTATVRSPAWRSFSTAFFRRKRTVAKPLLYSRMVVKKREASSSELTSRQATTNSATGHGRPIIRKLFVHLLRQSMAITLLR